MSLAEAEHGQAESEALFAAIKQGNAAPGLALAEHGPCGAANGGRASAGTRGRRRAACARCSGRFFDGN